MKTEILALTMALTPVAGAPDYVAPFRPSVVVAQPLDYEGFVRVLAELDSHSNTTTSTGRMTATMIDMSLQGYRLGWQEAMKRCDND